TPHGIEPTIYGQVLYEHAKSIDRELAQAAQHIQELAFGHRGALKIGATVGGAASLVALAVCRLQDSRPGIDIRINAESSIMSLLTQLHDRTIDMLICQRPHGLEFKGTRAFSLFRAKRVACVRAGHPLTGNVTLRDLSTYPFICPQEETGLLFGFRQIFATIGLDLPEVLISNSIHVTKEIVLNSDAFALLSDLSVLSERRLGLVRSIELEMPTQYWTQLMIREEQLPTELMKSFVAEILTVCKELNIEAHADAVKFRNIRSPAYSGQKIPLG
ncbi:MAG TPA: LysR substrate-binding domain-containing protein, partial [Alphaproteobacteria bacterium]|nr:LysR substrate-binding domain-containing protein [Alphaproteobacteria bacterium]